LDSNGRTSISSRTRSASRAPSSLEVVGPCKTEGSQRPFSTAAPTSTLGVGITASPALAHILPRTCVPSSE
jgi:hypothetical protein